MTRFNYFGCGLLMALGITLASGCDQQTNETVNNTPGSDSSAVAGDSKNNNQSERYTNAHRNPEQANSIQQGHQDMDVLTPEEPVMAYARYHTVEFNRDVAGLSREAEQDLAKFVASLEKDQPTYVTIRMEDADTLDVTEPTPEFKKLTETRVSQVMDQFKQSKVNVAQVKVDESGISETPGEGNALARPGDGDTGENDQLVVITIETEGGEPEPSDTLPHSPSEETLEG